MKASKLILYHGVKIDENNVTNLTPANLLTELLSYKVDEFEDLNLVLENFTLRVPAEYYSIYDSNYMAFQNYGYSNKWFFAFIQKVDYISDSVCEIKFAIDYWSTFYSDLTFLKCFVEREITATDTIGENLQEEDLSTGEVTTVDSSSLLIQGDGTTGSFFYVGIYTDYFIASSEQGAPVSEGQFNGITFHNLNCGGHQLIIFPIHIGTNFDSDVLKLLNYIQYLNFRGHIEDLKDMFIIPMNVISSTDLTLVSFTYTDTQTGIQYDTTFYNVHSSETIKTINAYNITKLYTFSDYTPLNNKVYTYPYNFINVSNNVGNHNILRYEDFSDATVKFDAECSISIGCSVRLVPVNYKGKSKCYDEQLPLAKFPTCGWSADSFTNWLTQNAVNIGTNTINKGISTVSLATMSGGIGAIPSAVNSALGLIGTFRQASLMPNIEGGQNTGDVNFGSWSNNFVIDKKRIKLEQLKVIDDYFTKFGYKINRVKVPNLTTSRFNHFYIKIGLGEKAVTGIVPEEGIREIENKLYNGITVWKSIANIGNYESGTVI